MKVYLFMLCAFGLLIAVPAGATVTGLNSVSTPDLEPTGQLAVAYIEVDKVAGDPNIVTLELGVTPRLEVSLFEGFAPQETFLGAEYGIIQSKHYLLTAGFSNYTSMGGKPQPLLLGGYLSGRAYYIVGATYAQVQNTNPDGSTMNVDQTQTILGFTYQINSRFVFSSDHQNGTANFSTIGITYNFSNSLNLNPALYFANSGNHPVYGFAVLTYTFDAFKGLRDVKI